MHMLLKTKLTGIAGTVSIILAGGVLLGVCAIPDNGPAPSATSIVLAAIFVFTPLLGLGIWLRRRARNMAQETDAD